MPLKQSGFGAGFDGLTSYGAETLKQHIMSLWANRGHRDVQAWRHEIPGFPGNWQVRSNLVGGLPPRVARVAHPLAEVAG